jgi:heme exporter protein C
MQGFIQDTVQTATYDRTRTAILNVLTGVTLLGFAAVLYLALFYANTDVNQGDVQRLFYVHVGSFTGGATAFFVTVIAGLAYLITRKEKWDRLAVSSVEVGLPLMTICLVTGMAWARPIWNTWWTADPRLNSMAVMWLMYAAYLTLRNAMENPERRMRFAAVYGILAFVSVFYTFIVIRIRTDTLHPVVIGPSPVESAAEGAFEVRADSRTGFTMGMASVWWMVAALTLLWHRVRLENFAHRVETLRARVLGTEA